MTNCAGRIGVVRWGLPIVVALATMLVSASIARAAPGDLDTSFGAGGKQTLNFGGTDRATKVVTTPDGRIVVVGSTDYTGGGDFAVARFTSQGAPDTSFNATGRVSLGSAANDIGGGVVVLPNEQIVAAGQGNATQDFVATRLNADGSLDTTFGSGGSTTVDFGGTETVNAMIRQPDGKLVLVGSTTATGGGDFAIVRLNADGSLDGTFAGGGKETIDFGGTDTAVAVALAPDGKIVVAGQGGPGSDMVATRLNTDGSIDTTFATAGKADVDFGGVDVANGVVVQPDGKIVMDGAASAVGSGDFAVARLTAGGSLDPTFSGDGKITLGYGAANESALAIALQQNGRIVVMGNGDANSDFVVSRLNTDGSVDSSFGTGGTVEVNFGAIEYDGDVTLQPDGRIVIAGSTNVTDGGDMALARLLGDPLQTTPTPTPTTTTTATTPTGAAPAPPVAKLTTQASADGKGVVVSAAGTTGATTLIWDLDGDGKPDFQGTLSDPFARLTLPQGGTRTVCVTAVSATGATDRACTTIQVPATTLPANRVPEVAVVTESPSLFTPKPAPTCKQGTVLQGIVDARGCFVHVTKLADVPSREQASARQYFGAEGLPAWFVKLCEDPTKATTCKAEEKTFTREYSGYLSTKTVKVNGMTLSPAAGATVVVDPQSARIFTSRGTLRLGPFVIKSSTAVNLDFTDLFKHSGKVKFGDLGYTGVTKALFSFDARKDVPIIGGFPLAAGAEIQFASDQGVRKSKVTLHVQLPQIFDAFGPGEQPSAAAVISATNDRSFFLDNLDIRVPHASIGGVGLDNLAFHYADGGDRAANCPRKYWHATADIHLGNGPNGEPGAGISLTPPPAQNGVAFCAGSFKGAGANLHFGYPIPPPQIFPAVFLDDINFAIALNPTLIRGGGTLSAAELTKISGTLLAVFARPWAPYTLTRGDAGADLQDLAGRRFTSTSFAVGGALSIHVPGVGDLNIAHGGAVYSYPDYVGVGAKVNVQLGIFVFDGSLGAQFSIRRRLFEIDASAHICVRGFSIACGGGLLVASEKGAVACIKLGPLNPGIGVMTNGHVDVWLPDGCKPSHYWSAGRSSFVRGRPAAGIAQGPIMFTVAKGETAKSLQLRGAGGAPRVLVHGPGGQSLAVASDGAASSGALQAISSGTYSTTWLGVKNGRPGRYTITSLPGSVPVSGVAETRPGYDSDFSGRVTGQGSRQTLHYDARKRGGGQKVTFYEDGASVMHPLATSTGGHGTVHFTPAAGAAGTRTIVARATVDGVPIRDQVLARFHFGGTVRTGRPGEVIVRRRGSVLVVSWPRAAGAVRYGVLVNRSGGSQQRYELPAARRTLRISGYPLTEGGRVGVSARGILGDWGPTRHSRAFKATRLAATVLVTRPFRSQRRGGR